MTDSVRVLLPAHLRAMAKVDGEIRVDVGGEVTQRSVLDAVEAAFPMLLGTIRDRATATRRPFVRFFACAEDLSHQAPDTPLPELVVRGQEPFLVVGAMAGG
jgi:sulfur-carrier protein